MQVRLGVRVAAGTGGPCMGWFSEECVREYEDQKDRGMARAC